MNRIAIGVLAAACCSYGAAAQEDGKALVERTCTKCHELTTTLLLHNSRERWSSIVDDMVSRGAEATDTEIEKIIDYLAKTQGLKINVNKADTNELASALDVSTREAAAVIEYRKSHGNFKTLDDLKKVPALEGKNIDSKKDLLEFSDRK